MELTQANLDFIFYGFDARYQSTYMASPTFYQRFTTIIPSTTRTQRYGWLDRIPRMRQWIGERQIVNISSRSQSVDNVDYELTLEVDRNVIQDDQVGLYTPHVDMLAYEAKLWPDQLMIVPLQNGDSSNFLAHDGQNFFSTSHPVDIDNPNSATQSNFFTGNLLTASNFATTRQKMIAYKAADNRPFAVLPDLLIVGPANEYAGRQLLNATFIAPSGGFGINAAQVQSNILQGMAALLVHPYLSGTNAFGGNDDTNWWLVDSSKPVKPFIFQLRQAPIFVYKNRPDDFSVFFRRKFLYGADSRGAGTTSLWFLASKNTQ